MTDQAKLKVINAAQAELGNEPLTDLNDDSIQDSGSAYKLLRSIELSRDVVLARHGWLCALEYTTLTPQASPAGNWKYPFQYLAPADCLRIWEVEGTPLMFETRHRWGQKWELGTFDTDLGARQILRARHSFEQLPIAYVRRCSWGALTPHLVDAIGAELAGRECYSINGDMAGAQKLKQSAEGKILMAISVEATQEGGQEPWAPSIPQAIRNLSR